MNIQIGILWVKSASRAAADKHMARLSREDLVEPVGPAHAAAAKILSGYIT
jgi:hypothetical protein